MCFIRNVWWIWTYIFNHFSDVWITRFNRTIDRINLICCILFLFFGVCLWRRSVDLFDCMAHCRYWFWHCQNILLEISKLRQKQKKIKRKKLSEPKKERKQQIVQCSLPNSICNLSIFIDRILYIYINFPFCSYSQHRIQYCLFILLLLFNNSMSVCVYKWGHEQNQFQL